ncbi:glycosyltransferase family 39 protein [Myxosarcina sp. GI1]|uniref:ArnT family glycosyltransferase n=1 Tax=Myxosarcina sp. GI1 TaxID=1541065 RepID=UPI00056A0415|nr:glycosyltransferase family 39 protein [Myxosarcina sp. GI1]
MKKIAQRGHKIEQYPKIYWIIAILWLLVISSIAFIVNLGSTSLVDETEPLFAEAARQMNVTGNWITPYFNGETRFDKPPLIYWLMAIAYKLIGVNEWAVRLPSALAAIALMCLGFFTLKRFGFSPFSVSRTDTDRIQRQLWFSATIGAALMSLNVQAIVWGRTGVSDMLLSGCMGCGLLCFFWGYVSEDKLIEANQQWRLPNKWYLAFYILIALAVLTKGPVGIVLPGLIIFCFLIYVRQFWRVLGELKLFWGTIIFLIITLPWYILVYLENGNAYLNSFFGYHNFQRFTDVVNGHDAPWYFYFIIVLALFAPWSVYLPLALVRVRFWRSRFWYKKPRQAQFSLFAACWFVCIFAFFSISVTKLPSYTLPLIPAAAILVALVWSEALTNYNSKIDRGLLISIVLNLLLAIALAIAFYFCPQFIGKDPVIPNLGEKVARANLHLKGATIWGTISLASIACLLLKHWRWTIFINLIGFLAFISLVLQPSYMFVDRLRQAPIKNLAQTVIEVKQPTEELWMLGFEKPSLVFYSQNLAKFFRNDEQIEDYYRQPDVTKPQASSVLIVSRDRELKDLDLQPQDYQVLDNEGVYKLIRISTQKMFESL